jgi:hypothetical protein
MANRKQAKTVNEIWHMLRTTGTINFACHALDKEKRVRTNRTARILRSVKTNLGSVARVSDENAITDILADLRLYCDSKGLAFRKLSTAANAIYLEVKEYEAE